MVRKNDLEVTNILGHARDLSGLALSKAELVSKLQAFEQAKQVLEEKFNGVVQEVSEIKCLLSG